MHGVNIAGAGGHGDRIGKYQPFFKETNMALKKLKEIGILLINNSIFAREIFSGLTLTDTEPIAEKSYAARHKKNREIYTRCTVKKNTTGPITLTGFDAAVHDTVCTLYAYGADSITIDQIGKVVAGDHRREITAYRRREILKSLVKMENIQIDIDASEEMEDRGIIAKGEQYVLSAKLLPIKWETDPALDTVFKLSGYLPLDRYAYDAKQLIKYPWSLMDIRQAVSCETIGVTALKWVLARRVATIKNVNNNLRTNRIRLYYYDINNRGYNGLFRDLVEDMFVTKGREIRDVDEKMDTYAGFCARILGLMCLDGYIDDYAIRYKNGHRIDAFDIVCRAGTKE